MGRVRSWQIVVSTLACSTYARVSLHEVARSVGCRENGVAQQVGCLFRAWGRDLVLDGKTYDPFLQSSDPFYGTSGSYGEVSPRGVLQILDIPADMGQPIGPEDIFTDLGSGEGRLALQVAICSFAATVIGLELSTSRHQFAVAMQNKLNSYRGSEDMDLRFMHGNILNPSSWVGSTVVFSNSIVFSSNLIQEMRTVLLQTLTPGALILSAKRFRGCRDDLFRSLGKVKVEVGWSDDSIDVYAYMRVPNFNIFSLPAPLLSHTRDSFQACVDHLQSNLRAKEAISKRLCSATHGPAPAWATQLEEWSLVSGLDTACAAREMNHLSDADLFGTNKTELYDFVRTMPWRTAHLDHDDSLLLYFVELNKTAHSMKTVDELMAERMPKSLSERLAAFGSDVSANERISAIPAELDNITGMLITARANINSIGTNGRSPLHMALTRNVTKMLLSAAADLHARDYEGNTPMHTAPCGAEQPASVTFELLQNGANINVVNLHGATPLHSAAKCSASVKLVQAMLSIGADASVKDANGKTAAEYASNHEVRGLLTRKYDEL